MENVLIWLKEKFKNHPSGWLALFPLVLFIILTIIGLFSDLGFGAEVTKYRFHLIFLSLTLSSLIVLVWFLVIMILENNKLHITVKEYENDLKTIKQQIQQTEKEISYSQQTILNLFQEITKGRIFEINKVQFYKNEVYLILSKKKSRVLNLGDEIKILDTLEGKIIGVFEISETGKTPEFRAKLNGYIDPVWEGYIRQSGNTESSAPPDVTAILFHKETNND